MAGKNRPTPQSRPAAAQRVAPSPQEDDEEREELSSEAEEDRTEPEAQSESQAEAQEAEDDDEDEVSLDFDLELQSVPVTLRDRNGVQLLRLWELDGTQRDKWLNKISKKNRALPNGAVQTVDHMGSHSALLSMCLRTRVAGDDGSLPDEDDNQYLGAQGKLVEEAAIQNYPSSVQIALLKKAQKLSGLGEDADDKAKKK